MHKEWLKLPALFTVCKTLFDSSARFSMSARVECRIDVESCGTIGCGGDIETTKDHRSQLAEMKPMLEVSGERLQRSIRSMRLEDAIDNCLNIRAFASEDNGLVNEGPLAFVPVLISILVTVIELLLNRLLLCGG